MAFKEAITWVGARDHATGCRVDAETVPMRAYVTSGLVPTREAPCVRATACWRRSLGVARMKAGDACVVLQVPAA